MLIEGHKRLGKNDHYEDSNSHWHYGLTVGLATMPPVLHPGDSVLEPIQEDRTKLGDRSHVVNHFLPDGTIISSVNESIRPGTTVDSYCPGHQAPPPR